MPGATHDQEFVFEQKGLCNYGTDCARTEQPIQDGNAVDEEDGQMAHEES